MQKIDGARPRWPLACAVGASALVVAAAVWGRVTDAHTTYDPIVALTALGTIGLVWYTFATRWAVDAQRLLAAAAAAQATRTVGLALAAEMVTNALRLDALIVLIESGKQLPSAFSLVDITFRALAGQVGLLPLGVSVRVINVYGFFSNLATTLRENEEQCREINRPPQALSAELGDAVRGVREAVRDALEELGPVVGATIDVPPIPEDVKSRWLIALWPARVP